MKIGRFLCVVVLLLNILWGVSAQPSIEIAYLKSSDVKSPSQAEIDFLREAIIKVQSFLRQRWINMDSVKKLSVLILKLK